MYRYRGPQLLWYTLESGLFCPLEPYFEVRPILSTGPWNPTLICAPYSSFGTAIQSSQKTFPLSSTPSPIPSRLGECWACSVVVVVVGGGHPSQAFHQVWVIPLGVFCLWARFPATSNKLKHLWACILQGSWGLILPFSSFSVNQIIGTSKKQKKKLPVWLQLWSSRIKSGSLAIRN